MKRQGFWGLAMALLLAFLVASPAGGVDKFLYDLHGGTWQDAEKDWVGDGKLCWAAAASNLLEWGNWDVPAFNTEHQIFEDFENHWIDQGGWANRGIRWWFDGTDPGGGVIDVPGGGNHWPGVRYDDYYHEDSISDNLMQVLDYYLEHGYASSFSIYTNSGGHAITVWGYSYDDTDSGRDYHGIYITDSDDGVNSLQYYRVWWNESNTHWYLRGGYDGWHIDVIRGLARNPSPKTAKYYFTSLVSGTKIE